MLYPNKIKIKRRRKGQVLKLKLQLLIFNVKKKIKYLIFDRKNLFQKIFVKLHI